MKSRRYSEEQIVRILGEIGSGRSVAETARQYGIAEATFYRWKQRYRDLRVPEIRRLQQLEDEHRWLRQLVAELALDRAMLQDVLWGMWGGKANACPPAGCGGLCTDCVGGKRAAGV